MPIGSPTGSAQIIPFPVRFRAPAASFEAVKPVADIRSKTIYDAAFSSSWYHEAAVIDASQGPKS